MVIKLANCDLDFQGHRAKNIANTPISGTDAINQSYADSNLAGSPITGTPTEGQVLALSSGNWSPIDVIDQAYVDGNLAGSPITGTPTEGQLIEFNGTSWNFVDREEIGAIDYTGNPLSSGAKIPIVATDGSTNSFTFSANVLYLIPYRAKYNITINGLSIYIIALNTASTLAAVAYAGDGTGHYPSTRLGVSSLTLLSGTGIFSINFLSNVNLIKGKIYYFGLSCSGSGSSTTVNGITSGSVRSDLLFDPIPFGTSPTPVPLSYRFLYKGSISGTPPDPFGSGNATSSTPLFWLKVA